MKRGMHALAMLLACALVLAMVRAGETYFACMRMGTVAEHACCGSGAKKAKSESPRHSQYAQCKSKALSCCEPLAGEGLRMVNAAPAPHIETAPLLGIVPPAPVVPCEPAGNALLGASAVARAGPSPRPPTPSFLSVYLI
ncbi:hypothetical protein LZC95_19010 [Pendulispora brunnea]|uniref:Hydrophobin n=1 Tax=Pendulispora brunnea TaxID=2905690 RepID=A0ABZ2KLF4_9BACT